MAAGCPKMIASTYRISVSPAAAPGCARQRHPTHQEQGFSILEVTFAYSIFTIALLGVASAMTHAFTLSMFSNHQTTTQAITQAILDEAMETGYDNLMNLDGNSMQEEGYTINLTVTQEDVNLRSILVAATKDGQAGTTLNLLAYVSKR